ncbi:MAG: hypothetical protein U9N45_08620, partial [Gemmatimonadota bacterium]|nr:hypothetical protein [Gemmatimonadota bacterium]
MRHRLLSTQLSLILLLLVPSLLTAAGKHIAGGEQVSRQGNRLISSLSPDGRQLYRPPAALDRKIEGLVLDGKASEDFWSLAQRVSPFLESAETGGAKRNCNVLVSYDRENIYLFWEIETAQAPKATVTVPDTALTGDSYVQLDLCPLIPDSIHYGRGYYYSVAVNPLGTVWDA